MTDGSAIPAELLTMFDTASDAFLLSDLAGRILYANQRFQALFGELGADTNLLALFPGDGSVPSHVARDPAFACDFEAEMLGLEGAKIPMQVRGSVVEIEGRRLATTWLRDLTELKAKEIALAEARKSADQAVQDLTITWFEDITVRKETEAQLRVAKEVSERTLQDLREAQEHLIEAEKMASLGGLVAGVAHEINTPVGTALTASSYLSDRTAEIRNLFQAGTLKRTDLTAYMETAAETTALLLMNLKRAARLVESFKQVATDSTNEEVRRFDVGGYIEEVLISLGPRIRQSTHRVVLRCAPGIEIESYPGPLAQVLTNLITNSITHAYEPGQTGTLTITTELEADGMLKIAYKDDGRGIPPEHQEKVFDPFFTTRRGAGGTGLGLHVVFQIVTKTLGGRIKLMSEPGAGCKFVIRIPCLPTTYL